MHTFRGSNGHCLSIVYFKQSLSHMYTCLSYSHISAFYNDFVEVFVIIKKGEIVGQLALANVFNHRPCFDDNKQPNEI